MPKRRLPTRTKIAAGWLLTIGTIWTIIWGIILYYEPYRTDSEWRFFWEIRLYCMLFIGALTIFPGGLLLDKTRFSWWAAVSVMAVAQVCILGWMGYVIWNYRHYWDFDFPWHLGISILIMALHALPLALTVLDRKNYWKRFH